MVEVKDVSINQFADISIKKRIIAIGAGRKLIPFIKRHKLINNLDSIIDGDVSKRGNIIEVGNNAFEIKGYDYLDNKEITDNRILLITAFIPVVSILESLDRIPSINGMECYIAPLMEENFFDETVKYTMAIEIIPRRIHYFWFGRSEIPDNLKKYIESWRRIMPDYELVRWDESNYDITKNRYMKEAYECGKFGFVPDYARLDVLYRHGGIYLDTDVEVLKRFDDLLCDRSFMGYFDCNVVALGAGFGCVKGNDLIGEFRDYYDGLSFFDKYGKMNTTTCIEYQYPVLESYGFSMNNEQQCINGNMLYPVQMFNPDGKTGIHTHYTNDTHSIHHSQISYEEREVQEIFKARTNRLEKRINNEGGTYK